MPSRETPTDHRARRHRAPVTDEMGRLHHRRSFASRSAPGDPEGYSGVCAWGGWGLLQRPGAGSVVGEGAEYRRFLSRAPARSGSSRRIRTTRRRGRGGGRARRSPRRPRRPPRRPRRARGSAGPGRIPTPDPVPGAPPAPGSRRKAADPSRTRRFPVERASPARAFDWKPTRSRRTTGRGPANRSRSAPSPPTPPRPLPDEPLPDEKDSTHPAPGITFPWKHSSRPSPQHSHSIPSRPPPG